MRSSFWLSIYHPCTTATLTDDHPSIADLTYVVAAATPTTGAFSSFTSSYAECFIVYSMELYDEGSASWKTLDSTNFPLMNNIVFTFAPATRLLQVGVYNEYTFVRTDPY